MAFSTETLKKVAIRIGVVGGVGTFVALNTIPYIYSERIRKTEHYKQALQLLRSNTEAVKYLGEPIAERPVQPTKRENFGTDGVTTWVRVPVVGPKDKGMLFYEYPVNESNNSTRVELTLSKLKDYKLIIKKPD
ncbi:hypothetical protein TSAR_004609 [Trichomalopsis sarcophagae]|uniref:Uncharacterized protein n=1 Tax=Trichomalopsis sarcophagae TaxID=543379 RepID=A0A232EWU8_9HYME|nr:hypothetical protein TSAR_004609 [Trichomalopsis sarcophagae]